MPIAEQCNEHIVISKKEEVCAAEHIPEARTAFTLPARFPVLPKQVNVFYQLTEGPPLAPCHLFDELSWMTVAARKQSESLKAASREDGGAYLERAAAYVRERLSRHARACDTFALVA